MCSDITAHHQRATLMCCASQSIVPWPHNQGKRVGSDDMEDLRHRSHNLATLQKRIGGNMETIMRDSRCRARWRQLVRGAARTADRDS